MATKRKVVKKDIKKDPLVTYALKVSQYSQEHFNQIVIGVVVLVALIAVVVFTTNSRRSTARQAERQLAQAMSLYQQGDFESAKTIYNRIIQSSSGRNAAISRYYKADSEMLQNNFSQALFDYEAYLENSSKFPEFKESAMYAMAICQETLQNYALAAATMEQVHHAVEESDPRYLDSAFKAGELFAQAGNNERAAHYFQTVADKATGSLKDKATVAVTLLQR